MFELGRVDENRVDFRYEGLHGKQSLYGDCVIFTVTASFHSADADCGAEINLSQFCDELFVLETLSSVFRIPCRVTQGEDGPWLRTTFTVEIPTVEVVLYMLKSESKEFQQCLLSPNTLLRKLAREVLEKGDAIRDDYVRKSFPKFYVLESVEEE